MCDHCLLDESGLSRHTHTHTSMHRCTCTHTNKPIHIDFYRRHYDVITEKYSFYDYKQFPSNATLSSDRKDCDLYVS